MLKKDNDIAGLSDENLMRFYQAGDEMAFEELYKRYSGRVYGYLMNRLRDRTLSDDLLQITFLKLHQSRESYRAVYPFAPWLFTVCRSAMIDYFRRKKQPLEKLNEEAVVQASQYEHDMPDLRDLSEDQKRVITLRYQEDLSFEEIALRLETSSINVRKKISRAIKKLKTLGGGNK